MERLVSTASVVAFVSDTTLLDVLEQVPQLLMTVAEAIGREHKQTLQNNANVRKQLNILRLVSKRASLAVIQGYVTCHLRMSTEQDLQRTRYNAVRRVSHLLTGSHLTHLRVSIGYTCGLFTPPSHWAVDNNTQLKDFLHILGSSVASVTHLELTTRMEVEQLGSLLGVVATISTTSVIACINVLFRGVMCGHDVITHVSLPSTAPSAMLAKACPNLQHLTINQVCPASSLKAFSKHCRKLTSLKLEDFFCCAGSLYMCMKLVPRLTHLTIMFKHWKPSRADFLQAVSASPKLTHLTLGEGSMGRMEEWDALPASLQQVCFLLAQPVLLPLGLLSKHFEGVDEGSRPPRFDRDVIRMLGLRTIVAENERIPYVVPIQLTCTKVATDPEGHRWACTKAVRLSKDVV